MLTSSRRCVILMAALCFMSSPFVQGKEPDVDLLNNTSTGPNDKTKRVFEFKLTPKMKTSDLDDPKSSLSKMIAFIVKGAKASATEFVSIETTGKTTELKTQINDKSIFVPGDDPANTQYGFRRTDVLPAIDKTTALTGTTTFYQTIRFDSKAPLQLQHQYLLTSIEAKSGDHVFDIITGSDFESENTAGKKTKNADKIRVRDWTNKVLFEIPLDFTTIYNLAVMVDWTANTLTVFASTGSEPLKKVAGPAQNDPKVILPENHQNGEYHLQLIKFPLPDPKILVAKRGDVPHVGIQEAITQEWVYFSNVYVTSGKGIEQPHFGEKKGKHQRCRL